MFVEFHALESVSITVPSQIVPIGHYLRQPQRIINTLSEQSRVKILSEPALGNMGHQAFRLEMQSLRFLQLTIQPVVDMDVWTEKEGAVHLRSIRTKIRGTDWIDRRFTLELFGQIAPHTDNHGQTRLVGNADLKVCIDMPPIFRLTPHFVLEVTGNSLLKSVLLKFKQRLMQKLVADYVSWASNRCKSAETLNQSAIEPA